jgi:hypothetical protein
MYRIDGGAKMKEEQNGKRPLSSDEVSELVRMLRVEVEFRRTFLKKNNTTSIDSIPDLLARFEEEKAKFITVKKLREGVTLTSGEYYVVDLCKRYGYQDAQQEFLKMKNLRTWYRIKKSLRSKGVYLECILNSDWRLDIEAADNLEDYVLEVA